MTEQRIKTGRLSTRQLRNLEMIHRDKCPVIVAGDTVRVRLKYTNMARCYQFKAAGFERIKGEVVALYTYWDDHIYAQVDFCQRHMKRRPDGKFHGENAEPSRFEIGTEHWPIEMLELVK